MMSNYGNCVFKTCKSLLLVVLCLSRGKKGELGEGGGGFLVWGGQ